VTIYRITPEAAPRPLLLLADASIRHIESYLPGSSVFVGDEGAGPVAVAVLKLRDGDAELWNIAIAEPRQRAGLGRILIEHLIRWAREAGARRLLVGTGNSSFGAMAFYQKNDFRMAEVVRDFFASYEPPIFENGISCRDMILFSRDLS
jgi:GNAT superfamily N-acetyltransferase